MCVNELIFVPYVIVVFSFKMNFTNSEKLEMLNVYFLNHKNCSSAAQEYAQQYPERRPPNRKYFARIIENLRRTGSFDKKREGVKTVVTQEVETDIMAFFSC